MATQLCIRKANMDQDHGLDEQILQAVLDQSRQEMEEEELMQKCPACKQPELPTLFSSHSRIHKMIFNSNHRAYPTLVA